MQPKKRQHYVPQFYLRHWADQQDKLWCYPITGKASYQVGTANVALEKHLYTHSGDDGIAPMKTEDDLGSLEDLYAPLWSGMIENAEDSRTRMNLARFIALMDLRHPKQKLAVQAVNEAFCAAVSDLPPGQSVEFSLNDGSSSHEIPVKKIVESTKAEEVKKGFLRMMRNLAEDYAKILAARRWAVLCSPIPAFVTSDHPVTLHRGLCQKRAFGIRTPGTWLFFPLTPSRLLMVDDALPVPFAYYDTKDVEKVNRFIVEGAYRFVFGKESLESLRNNICQWRSP